MDLLLSACSQESTQRLPEAWGSAASCRGNLPHLSSFLLHLGQAGRSALAACTAENAGVRLRSSLVPPVNTQAPQLALERPSIDFKQLGHGGDVLVLSQEPLDVLDFQLTQ